MTPFVVWSVGQLRNLAAMEPMTMNKMPGAAARVITAARVVATTNVMMMVIRSNMVVALMMMTSSIMRGAARVVSVARMTTAMRHLS
jgi:hypothetical protein